MVAGRGASRSISMGPVRASPSSTPSSDVSPPLFQNIRAILPRRTSQEPADSSTGQNLPKAVSMHSPYRHARKARVAPDPPRTIHGERDGHMAGTDGVSEIG